MNPKIQQQAKTSIFELSRPELAECLHNMDQPAFRSTQVWQWVWQKRCRDFAQMTNVGKSLRTSLDQAYSLELPALSDLTTSQDGTMKGLLRLFDDSHVEWVLIPDRDHYTLCLSTQAGCPLACTFCSTGQMGFERNLTAGEILSQVLVALETLKNSQTSWSLRNIVFMGMGEPLLNWPQVEKSLHVLRDPLGLGFSHRRVTVSSVGIPDVLEEFAHTGLASLAVSLHAPTQDLRQKIMPKAARRFPLPELVARLQELPLKPRQRITIEYILLAGINDGLEQARELNRLLAGVKCKINLICFNPAPDLPYSAPDPEDVLRFERFLWSKGQTVTLRKSKGQDIQAACGQLRKADEGQTHIHTGPERSDHAKT
ncbi:MAG: 23S rRNA (adenine(2503)-C(2))-methyltransferase RlmN [Desulfovermiculus sp.]